MGNAKAEREELKKLEDEAYNELCQIIAEAMQVQDITLLDQRIANWKKKYKKLLDSSSPSSSNFKKRIEYLLNQFYSEITQYILKQIKKSEQKRIENQSKALRKLRYIIDETDDLSLLKKKVREWENKYPISGFITMYQKRIKIYTSEKYLKENAFDQDMAFRDLYYITRLNYRTYDELKEEVGKWEDKYSINDKFKLDDFIKHSTEINRYTSDAYLKSIAHADNNSNEDFTLPEGEVRDSDLEKQSKAYSSLLSIAKKPNNVNEIFNWVYKHNGIKFNDKYKDLILRAIYLDYSPAYLNSLSVPKINLSSSLSFEEYKNIDELKRYTVISYFNLLLPPGQRIPNNYFNENIEKIYRKSKTAHFSNEYDKVDKTLEENTEIKIISPETEVPELEIDISEGQVVSLASDIVLSAKTIENNPSMVSEEGEILLSETVLEPEEIVDIKSTSIKEPVKPTLLSEDISIVEEKPGLDILTNSPVVESKIEKISSEKSNENFSNETHPVVDDSKLIDLHNTSKLQKDSSLEQNSDNTSLESDSITSDTVSKPKEDIKTKTVSIETKPKAIILEETIDRHPEDLTIAKKTSKSKSSDSSEKTILEDNIRDKPNIAISTEPKESQYKTEDLPSDVVIGISPLFFEVMNNKVHMQEQQETIVTMIDTHVENYMSMTTDKTNDISKTRIDSN